MKKKTTLEMFKEIQDLDMPDGVGITVKDIVPFMCEKVESSLQRLESIDNANPSEALECLKRIKKYYIPEPCSAKTYDGLDTIKQVLLKAQEPKKYLKWEDLEFKENNEYSYFKVKLGDNVYKAFSYFSYVFNKNTVVIRTNNQIAITEDNKQFFNDLHLERVLE